MKYRPKTIPSREVDIPDIYHQRVIETINAWWEHRLYEILRQKDYLDIPAVLDALGGLGRVLSGKENNSAKAYDLAYLTVVAREAEHDREAANDPKVRSGEFKAEITELIKQIREVED